ncbi:DoxX family protein [Chitinophaga sp. SYP-B3965]|uniref:DoxX family protein n=1 Tax=Chitinophaga sp. SYP-B3965 TaxID=2663120 RepID=UPI00129962CA|nr:DoxX family protein [Chitinophaga sp. SYP-B3965]MRG49000.1 DoxX family protein [Chitinophaga sp. SYP-B3965]
MKNIKYWSLTCAISFFILFSAYYSGTHAAEFAQLGFPEYFRIELTIAKIIGAVVLLFPQVPVRIKEWVYVAFSINLFSAFLAKLNTGSPVIGIIEPLTVLALLILSAWYLRKNLQPN